jgi:GTPase SAR1 family protein
MIEFIKKYICLRNKIENMYDLSPRIVEDEYQVEITYPENRNECTRNECVEPDITTVSIESPDTTNPISMERQYNVLVLGERGTGKTSFIHAMKEYISNKPQTFSESYYSPTTCIVHDFIPETNANNISVDSIFTNTENGKYCEDVSNFIIYPHYNKMDKYYLLRDADIIRSNVQSDRVIGEIMVVEIPSVTKELPKGFVDCFDKIIIMGDYNDNNSLRSVRYWAEFIDAPRSKMIVCVNKCDVTPIDDLNGELRKRKAMILKYFADRCDLEFMSIKTGANVGFLYKYM